MFWSEYTNFNHKNDPFDSNELIWNIKYISDGNSHLWNKKYSLPSNRVIGFVDCRVTSKTLGIGYIECSWSDIKKPNQERYQLLVMISMRSRVLCIHVLVLKNQGAEAIYLTQIVNIVHTITLGIMRTNYSDIN